MPSGALSRAQKRLPLGRTERCDSGVGVTRERAKYVHHSKTQSKFRGNGETCPFCGITYGQFKIGMTYNEVFIQLWSLSDDPKDWRYKKRNTILGYWHSLKKKAWKEHQVQCEVELSFSFTQEASEDTPDIPF